LLGPDGVSDPNIGYNKWFTEQNPNQLTRKPQEAATFFRSSGIKFKVHGLAEAQRNL
jgi:uncharacterized circularly permuted ATP-grasp superfamily protein